MIRGCVAAVLRSGAISFEIDGSADIISPPGVLQKGIWHHVCIVFPPKSSLARKLQIIVDGVLVHASDLPDARLCMDKARLGSLCIGGSVTAGIAPAPETVDGSASAATKMATITTPTATSEEAATAASASLQSGESATKEEKSKVAFHISSSDAGSSLVGDICEVRLWGGLRTVDSVAQALGRSKVSGVESNLLLLLAFEEGGGSTLRNLVSNSAGSSSSFQITLHGEVAWGHLSSSFPRDELTHIKTSALEQYSQFSLHMLQEIAPVFGHQTTFMVDEEEAAADTDDAFQADKVVTILDVLRLLVCKLVVSADRYMQGEISVVGQQHPQPLQKSLFRTVQAALPSTKSVAEPHVLNFLLINSLLRQIIRMRHSPSLVSSTKAALRDISVGVLRILRVNFLEMLSSGISPAALGLQYSRTPDSSQKSFVSKLLISVLFFVSDDASGAGPLVSSVAQQEAVSAVVEGINIFFPHACDQNFLLICLLSK
jgi:hypothetical protein